MRGRDCGQDSRNTEMTFGSKSPLNLVQADFDQELVLTFECEN